MSIYLLIYLISLPFVTQKLKYTDWWKRFWCRSACIILGIRLSVVMTSENLPDTYLTICNHLSFFDPVVALAVVKGMPVAKAEIANYPLIGFAAKKTGIIWVERQRNSSRSVAKMAIQNALSNGKSVLVYPEATISHSPLRLRKFKKGSFAAAQQADIPIVYCAIHYSSANAYWKAENSLMKQFLLHFSSLQQEVQVHLSEPKQVDDPEITAKQAHQWIENQLRSMADAADPK